MTSPSVAPRRRRPVSSLLELRIAHRGLTVYRVAAPAPGEAPVRWAWNRYGDARPIGIGVVLGQWCWSLTWSRAHG